MKTSAEKGITKFLIIGTPGIRKSLFTLYFMKRYYNENNNSALFGFQRDKGVATILTPDGKVYLGVPRICYEVERNLVFICDAIGTFEPSDPNRPKLMIVISSPDDSRYKQYVKQSAVVKLTMPVWSKEELDDMFDLYEMDRLHEKVIDIASHNEKPMKQSMYEIYGGVPRSIISLDSSIMLDALCAKGSIVAKTFFHGDNTPGTGKDIENNYNLVHMVHPTKEDGSHDYIARRLCVIASKYVLKALKIVNKSKVMCRWLNYIANTGTGGIDASLQGNIFEWVFYNNPPKEMKIYALNKKASRDNTTTINSGVELLVKVPTTKAWPDIGNLSAYKSWKSNVLYYPNYRTLESGDAFFMKGSKKKSELFILQLTVAKSHPVKAKGLLKIVKFFKDSGYSIDSNNMKMYLVFVKPLKQNVAKRDQMTNYQAITSEVVDKKLNKTLIIISDEEDNRIIDIFENQSL